VITEAEAQALAEQRVTLTLMDGTEVTGYLFTPGYQGLRIQVDGVTRTYVFSEIRSVETASWAYWKRWRPVGTTVGAPW